MKKSGSASNTKTPALPKWQTRGRLAHRLGLEDLIRQELENASLGAATPTNIDRSDALRALASVDELKVRYLKDRNPVDVFNAIKQIGFASRILQQPICFPPWVQAYLLASADWIMGRAVAWSPKPKVQPAPIRHQDGSVHRVGDSQSGLSGPARLDKVLQALLFKPGSGRNPVVEAHRFYASVDRAQTYERNRSKNLSAEQAIAEMEDPQLNVADPQRKLRRDRRRIKRPKPTP